MKKLFLAIILTFFATLAVCQTKTIRGKVIHSRSKSPVAKVHIFPEESRQRIFSSPRGLFKIELPKEYFRNITFERPGYYPYQLRISKGSNLRPLYIELVPDTMHIDTFCYPSFPENRYLEGEVFEKRYRNPVENAVIRLPDGKALDYSDEKGYFETGIPDTCEMVLITKDGYAGVKYPLEAGNRNHHAGRIYITLLDDGGYREFWTSEKNALSLMVNELITGSVGICYERYLHLRHSVGLKTSWYLYGKGHIPLFSTGTSRFHGLKFSPMYRFYFWRNMIGGFFVEGKLTYGYFDFYELYYYAPVSGSYRGFYSQERTSAYGFGTSIGLSRKLRQGPVFINLSIGWQYLPLRVTQTKINKGYGDLPSDVDDDFWYIGGPGSFIEVKFILGGLF